MNRLKLNTYPQELDDERHQRRIAFYDIIDRKRLQGGETDRVGQVAGATGPVAILETGMIEPVLAEEGGSA